MRKILVSVALATATLAAVPAAAQHRGDDRQWDHQDRQRDHRDDRRWDRDDDRRWDHGDDRRWDHRGPDRRAIHNLLAELNYVEQRIDRSARRGIISPREAFSLRREANLIRNRLHRSGRDGISGREFASLRVQVNRLEQRLRYERRDRDGWRG